jgi:MEMO1 family protein
MRSPAVAGAFYEGSESKLRVQIESCYTSKLGPGSLPQRREGPNALLGLVVPHAGYVYSGPVAAFSYSALADDGLRPAYVVLGPNHYGVGAPLATTHQDWKTPLGAVPVDAELVGAIHRPPIEDDVAAHRQEHSIEVQLPFLQHLDPAVRFVPVCMAFQEYDLATEVGEIVAEAVGSGNALAIASSDFTHVGAQYGRMPSRGMTAAAYAHAQDRKAIERILALDPKGFADCVTRNDITMCGYGPVTALLTAARKLGATRAELLRYGTSSDVSGDGGTAVGYAAIAIYR